MPRIRPVARSMAAGRSKALLETAQATLGNTPNMVRTLARSQAALDSFLAMSAALSRGVLLAKARGQIALAVANENGCDYSASAYAALGRKSGLSETEIDESLEGRARNPRMQGLLDFSRAVVAKRGKVSDSDIAAARAAGVSDAELIETVAHVALNLFANYVNHVAATEIDFPLVETPKRGRN
ncbi:MAG: carboxymuconolactone decarboxylase family protein [Pseudomonadota bacterium]|nr:carboxymuconolactone decarboxylase family protein [Pseudomonadota bacterium]